MKRFLALCCCAALLLSMAACAYSSSPKAIRDAGIIRVAMMEESVPFVYVGDDGKPCGADVEIAEHIAQSLGVQIKYVNSPFAEVLDNVKNGKADIGIATIIITGQRMNDFTFSVPYHTTGLVAAVSGDFPSEPATDLALNDYRIAVMVGSVEHQYVLDSGFSSFNLTMTESESMEMVINGEADVALIDEPVGTAFVKANPGKIKLLPGRLSECNYGVIAKLGNTALIHEVNKAIADMREDGTLDEILSRYLDYSDS